MKDLVPRREFNRGLSPFGKGFFGDDLFSHFWEGFGDVFGDNRYTDKDGNLVYEIECPGFNKDNLAVEIAEGILTVKGERGDGNKKREIFKRMNVSASENVEAEIKDGILTLVFKFPEKKSTKVEIKG